MQRFDYKVTLHFLEHLAISVFGLGIAILSQARTRGYVSCARFEN
jgi:hypothetical protein